MSKTIKRSPKFHAQVLIDPTLGIQDLTGYSEDNIRSAFDNTCGSPCRWEKQGDGVTLVYNDTVNTGPNQGMPVGWYGSLNVPTLTGRGDVVGKFEAA